MQLTEHVGVKMDPRTKARLDRLAQRTGRSRGAVIRALIQTAEAPGRPDIRAGRDWTMRAGSLAGREAGS